MQTQTVKFAVTRNNGIITRVGRTMTGADLVTLQSDILGSYYADNAKKLHKVVDRILSKFGGLSNRDKDDFYSLL